MILPKEILKAGEKDATAAAAAPWADLCILQHLVMT